MGHMDLRILFHNKIKIIILIVIKLSDLYFHPYVRRITFIVNKIIKQLKLNC